MQYNVTGMSCAACSARVEKAVLAVSGVSSCSVNLLTQSMTVEGTADSKAVISAVESAGYRAALKSNQSDKTDSSQKDLLKDSKESIIKNRLIPSLVLLVILMYFSMGHMMWNWPLPKALSENHIAMGIIQLLLTSAVLVINQSFFISGTKSFLHRAPNMDSLVAMGSTAAFVYSIYALFAMTGAQLTGDHAAVMSYMHEFYFETAAMIPTLITLGKVLEEHSKGKTTNALKSLMELAPKTAIVIRNGEEAEVPAEQVKKGDIFVVRPGDSIPADGLVIEGNSAVNESALTGESIPVDKSSGDKVSAATLNQSGFLKCEATGVGEDTALSQIIRLVSDASATKAPVARIADKVSGVFVPAVILIAAITTVIWLLIGETVGFSLARGISVLVISCPCALGLATPVAIMVGNGVGAKNGILFKNAVSTETAGKIEIAALDKTGTITKGEPEVTDIIPSPSVKESELLSLAYSIEKKSEHPLAGAVVRKAELENAALSEVSDFKALPGNGLSATLDGISVSAGSMKFIESITTVSDEMKKRTESLASAGKTPLFFCQDGKLMGIIAVADTIKDNSRKAIKELHDMGIRVVMLTGDNERTARAIGDQVGVDEVIAGVMPDAKERVVQTLMKKGRTAMVGDGINDAPALTRADVGIAIGAGTDVAIDAADIVLMKSNLSDVPAAIRLSRATLKNIHENLFWAFFYNAIGIPLAAGLFIPVFGWELNPMFGAAAMSLSSFCVVSNALRLNLVRIRNTKKYNRPINKKLKETKSMERTIKIEGMMCGHCEARVKKTLESLDGITIAHVCHETGEAIVTMSKSISDGELRKAIEDQGYTVTELK